MQQYTPSSKNSKWPFLVVGAALIVLLMGFFGALAYLKGQNSTSDPVASSQGDGRSRMVGPLNTPPAVCKSDEPCTSVSDSAASCGNDGPCLQNSSGQQMVDGIVTAVDGNSISLKSTLSGTVTAYVITGKTRQSSGGSTDAAFNPAAIQVGSTVGLVVNDKEVVLVMLNFRTERQNGSDGRAY